MTNFSNSQSANRAVSALFALVLTAASMVAPVYVTKAQAAVQSSPAPVSLPLA